METLFLTFVFMSIIILLFIPRLTVGFIMAIASLSGYYYFAGIDSWAPIILLVVGLVLIVSEIFIPGFGLLGLLGFSSIVLGLYYTTGNVGKTMTDLIVAVAVSTILIIILFKKGYSFTNWEHFVLNTQIKSEEITDSIQEDRNLKAGMIGKASTSLRPSGKALFNKRNAPFDVLSDDGHISQGTEIIIQEIIGSKIVVRKYNIEQG